LGCGPCANRTVESALYQALRAQARGIAGTQFLSALWAVWHFSRIRNSYFKALPSRL
jgi:hypothetical protein